MSYSLRACFLLFAMAWQALVCAAVPGVARFQLPPGHVFLHAEHVEHHHHHGDATVHVMPDPDDALEHHHTHDGPSPSGLIGVGDTWAMHHPHRTLNAHRQGPWSSVVLDGWLRPPSAA